MTKMSFLISPRRPYIVVDNGFLALPTYRSIKLVKAAKITRLERIDEQQCNVITVDTGRRHADIQVTDAWLQKHEPQVGGYFVVYQDGYCSYSPSVPFEKGHIRIDSPAAETDRSNHEMLKREIEKVAKMLTGQHADTLPSSKTVQTLLMSAIAMYGEPEQKTGTGTSVSADVGPEKGSDLHNTFSATAGIDKQIYGLFDRKLTLAETVLNAKIAAFSELLQLGQSEMALATQVLQTQIGVAAEKKPTTANGDAEVSDIVQALNQSYLDKLIYGVGGIAVDFDKGRCRVVNLLSKEPGVENEFYNWAASHKLVREGYKPHATVMQAYDELLVEREELQKRLFGRPTTWAELCVLGERERQITEEGYTEQLDDKYNNYELLSAALCYLLYENFEPIGAIPAAWPWAPEAWKPKDYRRNLVTAAALLLAELDRLDRAKAGKVG